MPLPEHHLIGLQEQLQFHEERLNFLQVQAHAMEREIRAHEIILGLARQERILALLGEFADSPEAAERASRDPLSYARQRGVELPDGLQVSVDMAEEHVLVQVTYTDDVYPFVGVWDRSHGFSLQRLVPPTETSA
jgi:hypothetical protein